MTWLTAIVDTNVLVSGLLSPNPVAPTRQIVRGMLTAQFPFVVSVELMQEYWDVLGRPAITRRHRLSRGELGDLLFRLAQDAIIVEPVAIEGSPDPGDTHVWSLLEARQDAVLVSGDGALQRRATRGRVISPRGFAEDLTARRPVRR